MSLVLIQGANFRAHSPQTIPDCLGCFEVFPSRAVIASCDLAGKAFLRRHRCQEARRGVTAWAARSPRVPPRSIGAWWRWQGKAGGSEERYCLGRNGCAKGTRHRWSSQGHPKELQWGHEMLKGAEDCLLSWGKGSTTAAQLLPFFLFLNHYLFVLLANYQPHAPSCAPPSAVAPPLCPSSPSSSARGISLSAVSSFASSLSR